MNNCYCENKEHEICYDGIIGTYDENCECCKDTSNMNVIEGLKKKGIQNINKLYEDIEEDLFENPDMVRELIKDYVKTYDVDEIMSWLEERGINIEDYLT